MNRLRRFYWGQSHIDFVGRYRLWIGLSVAVVVVALAAIAVRGLNLSIDFAGGTTWRVPSNDFTKDQAEDVAAQFQLEDPTVREAQSGGARVTYLESRQVEPETAAKVTDALAQASGLQPDDVDNKSVGATWGDQVTQKALVALLIFLILVVGYITIRFEFKMAITAILEVFHDLIIVFGVYALGGFQVSPATVIGVLTMLGYSLYDAVVVFDKVRENAPMLATGKMSYGDLVNLSMNQTLARSLGTTLTSFVPAACLLFVGAVFLGATALEDLSLALTVGIASGAYSSIFFASPVLAKWKETEPQFKRSTRDQTRAERKARSAAVAAVSSGPRTASSAPDDEVAETAGVGTAASASARPVAKKQARPHGRSTPVARKRRRN
ncbi:MAG: protein translocase subunit SecF [Acidimicrobiia bacterium]